MRLISLQDWVEQKRAEERKPLPEPPEFHDEGSFGESPDWTRWIALLYMVGLATLIAYPFLSILINGLK